MLRKRIILRIFFFLFTIGIVSIIIYSILKTLEKNVVYFFSPTEVYNETDLSYESKIRIGGLVKLNSVNKNGTVTNFIITDLNYDINVSFDGIVPNLFSEGKGVVAEGKLRDKKFFVADKILAKHDENYMPPEVYNALEKSNN